MIRTRPEELPLGEHKVIPSFFSLRLLHKEIKAYECIMNISNNGSHNVYEVNGRFRCAQGCEANGGNGNPSPSNWISEVTFHAVETVNYICQPHIGFGMQGSVTVLNPTHSVPVLATIENNFAPQDVTIVQGQTINFINLEGNHNIHFADESRVCSIGCSDDGSNLQTTPTGFPWDINLKFYDVGEFPFYCDAHEISGSPGIIRVIPDLIFSNGFN